MEVISQLYPLGNNIGNHWVGGWVGHRSGLDGCGEEKNLWPLPELDFRTVQPVAHLPPRNTISSPLYTDYPGQNSGTRYFPHIQSVRTAIWRMKSCIQWVKGRSLPEVKRRNS